MKTFKREGGYWSKFAAEGRRITFGVVAWKGGEDVQVFVRYRAASAAFGTLYNGCIGEI